MVSKQKLGQSAIKRQRISMMWTIIIITLSAVAIFPIISILELTIYNGIKALTPHFVASPLLAAEREAFATAFIGTAIMMTLATIITLPISILVGILCVEHPNHWIVRMCRLSVDILQGAPAIVIGIIVYCWMVFPTRQFSGLAGTLALVIIMMPVSIRSTEEVLKKIPRSLIESALALGVPNYRAIQKVMIPTAFRGILSGTCIAASRASGETAPLLLTAFGTPFIAVSLLKEMGALPLMIYHYSASHNDIWQAMAWGGALALITVNVILISASHWIGHEK